MRPTVLHIDKQYCDIYCLDQKRQCKQYNNITRKHYALASFQFC